MGEGGNLLTAKLAPKQAAALIGVSTWTLYEWRQKRIGPPWYRRETNRIYYIQGEIEAWEKKHACV